MVPLVPPRESEEGLEGTAIHQAIALELCQKQGAFCAIPLHLERKLTVGPMSQWIVGYCAREVAENTPTDWSLEVEVPMAYEFGRFILSGHIDALALSPDGTEAIGWDYKSGYSPVDEAELNEQVLGYLALIKCAYPGLELARFKIVQPRNDEEEGFPRITEVTVNWDETPLLERFELRMNHAIAQPNLTDSGIKQCRFCPAAFPWSCPSYNQEYMKAQITPEFLDNLKATPDDATLADVVISGRTIAGSMKTAEEMLHARLDANPVIDAKCGIRVSRKIENGAYKVPNPPQFYRELSALIPDADKRAAALSFSMTRTKDVIAETMGIPKTGKAALTAEGVFEGKLRPLVEQGTRRKLIFT